MQHGNNDGSIGDGSNECHCPVRTVSATDGDFVSYLHTTVLEHDVELFDFSCHIFVLQGDTFIICKGV